MLCRTERFLPIEHFTPPLTPGQGVLIPNRGQVVVKLIILLFDNLLNFCLNKKNNSIRIFRKTIHCKFDGT